MPNDPTPAAIRWLGEQNCAEVFALLGWDHPDDELDHSVIHGLGPSRDETARPGDWIVPDGNGWYQPVSYELLGAYGPLSAEPGPTGPHEWGAHDDKYCADSHADEPEGYNWGCHDGAYYGPCGHENCYGQDDYLGECPCACHKAGD